MIFKTQKTKKRNETSHYVYALFCPIENKIKYIGCSYNPKLRFKQHLADKTKSKKTKWIFDLKKYNKRPELLIISEYKNKKTAHKKEIELINIMGDVLLNNRKNG